MGARGASQIEVNSCPLFRAEQTFQRTIDLIALATRSGYLACNFCCRLRRSDALTFENLTHLPGDSFRLKAARRNLASA
jgi:hypothetical protein